MKDQPENQFSRTELLIGEDGVKRLQKAKVALFGIGGVGGYVAEALVRSGVGAFDLIDNDTVSLTNLNGQIIADYHTLGRYKTEVMRERMLSINPKVQVTLHQCFYLPETAGQFDFSAYDYVADCIDSVKSKVLLICRARQAGVPVISCMGAGNKLDAGAFRVADIEKTRECPLAKIVRRELRAAGVTGVKAVYSEEKPYVPQRFGVAEGERLIGSVSFVPSAAGLLLAGEIVKDLVGGMPRNG